MLTCIYCMYYKNQIKKKLYKDTINKKNPNNINKIEIKAINNKCYKE